ncbi:uncharacterized protein LOC142097159 isoform X2 [Mixophyes fleayi]|uniref:uncharacterized protein LOC142097159 isoform X2 n=1 Tax=Mixophyes fleayi TaxID=3061075 RepID=UPI003F4D9D20
MASSQKTEKSATEIENVADERKTVGILYWDNTDITWLKKNLKQEHVPYKRVPLPQQKDWESVVERSFCVILYHSQKSHRPITEMQMYIDYCNKTKDPNDMLIICDKDEDSIIHNSIKSLILTEAELDFCGYGKSNRETPERRFTDKVDQMQKVILKAQGSSSSGRTNAVTQTIGIFTRSDESEYSKLVSMLRTEQIQNIRPCYISNNNSQQFREDVSQCTFGILYHTKNRGRINVTDVTDSLYDEELRYLSKVLGREKVIVVIDDLEDSSDKTGTLKNQPSIQALSQDQFLFSHEEKTSEYISYCKSFLEGNKTEVDEKLKKIVDFIKIREKTHDVNKIRNELTQRIDNYLLDHGYTSILLQIFGSTESGRSSFIHYMKSIFTNEKQETVLGSLVPLRGVITMGNIESNYEGCKFYLHLGNVPLGDNAEFQESYWNAMDKIVRAKQNVKDLVVPIYIFRVFSDFHI